MYSFPHLVGHRRKKCKQSRLQWEFSIGMLMVLRSEVNISSITNISALFCLIFRGLRKHYISAVSKNIQRAHKRKLIRGTGQIQKDNCDDRVTCDDTGPIFVHNTTKF